MATAKATEIQRPLIQIDDEVREMTNEEFVEYERIIKDIPTVE